MDHVSPTLKAIGGTAIIYLVYKLYEVLLFTRQQCNDLPIIGLKNEYFAQTRATIRSIFKTQEWTFSGYTQYSSIDKPFMIHTIDRGPVAIIPPSHIKKIYGYRDEDVDMSSTASNTLQENWTVWDQKVLKNTLHMNVIRNQITRNLHVLTPTIAEELGDSFKRVWGTSSEWRDVEVWQNSIQLVASAANGAFLGMPLCRDDDFLTNVKDHSMNVISGAILINTSPPLIKYVVAHCVRLHCYRSYLKVRTKLRPVVQERIKHTLRKLEDKDYDWTPPSDGLQWTIEESHASGDLAQMQVETICHRILHMNVVSLHATSFTAQNIILDIFSTDPSDRIVGILREEASNVLKEAGGTWTRAAVQKLVLTDSAIRESMRLNPFAIHGLPRAVWKKEGIPVPGSDLHIPYGTQLSVPMEPIHLDDSIYPNARKYDAFRFARPDAVQSFLDRFENNTTNNNVSSNDNKGGKSTATLDDAFLGFGFGRHACPGRFFALNEVKILIAHMLLNYDVEHLNSRPKPVDTLWLKMPWNNGTIRVRRRSAE